MGSGSGSDDARPGAVGSSGGSEPAAGSESSEDRGGRPVHAVPGARSSAEGASQRTVQGAGQRKGSRRPGSGRGGGSGRRFDGLRRRPRFRLTRRAGILALALCTVMVTVAYPLQEYLAQRSQIAAQNAKDAQTARQIADLKKQLSQWSDPAYVEIQAREKLHYVLPGEIGFIVPSSAGSTEPLGMPSPSAQPWYDNLWSTLKSPSPSASPSPSP